MVAGIHISELKSVFSKKNRNFVRIMCRCSFGASNSDEYEIYITT